MLIEVNHPLLTHKVSLLRDKTTGKTLFRSLMREIGIMLAYKATESLPAAQYTLDTPLMPHQGQQIDGNVVVVPILRAGLGLAEGFMHIVPWAKEGHIGLKRDHDTHRPVTYYSSLPPADGHQYFVVDPMLATGYSAHEAIRMIKKHDPQGQITLVVVVAAMEGVRQVEKDFPDVPIYTASLDDGLNENAYIVPGLGDAGDRLFGTK